MKINVVGTSGVGKSTLSRSIAKGLDIPNIEMDQIFWKPSWTESADEEFFPKLEKALKLNSWVLDGNYSRTAHIKWKEIDIIVWVDYSFNRTLFQAIRRAIVRVVTKVELWTDSGNRESLRKLLSKDSIILWTINNYGKNKKKYQAMMESDQYSHIQFFRVQSPRESTELVQLLAKSLET